MITIKQLTGKTRLGKVVRYNLDELFEDGVLIASAGRKPGDRLMPEKQLSESQIAEAKRLLDQRDGEAFPDRIVTKPPIPASWLREDEDDD